MDTFVKSQKKHFSKCTASAASFVRCTRTRTLQVLINQLPFPIITHLLSFIQFNHYWKINVVNIYICKGSKYFFAKSNQVDTDIKTKLLEISAICTWTKRLTILFKIQIFKWVTPTTKQVLRMFLKYQCPTIVFGDVQWLLPSDSWSFTTHSKSMCHNNNPKTICHEMHKSWIELKFEFKIVKIMECYNTHVIVKMYWTFISFFYVLTCIKGKQTPPGCGYPTGNLCWELGW